MSAAITAAATGVVGASAGVYGATQGGGGGGGSKPTGKVYSQEEGLAILGSTAWAFVTAKRFNAELKKIDSEFDPYEMDGAFNSLYEAVIMPMERNFDENVLPSIQAAYSGGVTGASGLQSGAAAETEANSRRDLEESSAMLRYQERDKAIARNYLEYDRRVQTAQLKFNANQTPIDYLSAGTGAGGNAGQVTSGGSSGMDYGALGEGITGLGENTLNLAGAIKNREK